MGADHYKITDNQLSYDSVFDEFLDIALNETHPDGVADFKISPQIRRRLFGSKENEEPTFRDLITTSFVTMGIEPTNILSTAERQAVWLHFIKFELTNYILNTLQPTSCNFSCKDAIDGRPFRPFIIARKIFSLDKPISKDDFERDLDISCRQCERTRNEFP